MFLTVESTGEEQIWGGPVDVDSIMMYSSFGAASIDSPTGNPLPLLLHRTPDPSDPSKMMEYLIDPGGNSKFCDARN